MPVIEWKKEDGVAVLVMNNGENRHNPEFVSAMLNAFDEIEQDQTVTAVVITSSDEKNWSQGIDVQWIMGAFGKKDYQSIRDFIYGLNKIFTRILLYPVPVIAAINGHAFGNGSIMSCACDFRFMRQDRGFFCFPEVNLGIPFRNGMNAMIKKAVPMYKLLEMQFSGNRYSATELALHHIIVKACADKEALMSEAMAFAGTFQKKRGIFGELKKRLYKDIIDIIDTGDPAGITGADSLMMTD
jgi:enoyl-CoA hydratase/carnithine racemase